MGYLLTSCSSKQPKEGLLSRSINTAHDETLTGQKCRWTSSSSSSTPFILLLLISSSSTHFFFFFSFSSSSTTPSLLRLLLLCFFFFLYSFSSSSIPFLLLLQDKTAYSCWTSNLNPNFNQVSSKAYFPVDLLMMEDHFYFCSGVPD